MNQVVLGMPRRPDGASSPRPVGEPRLVDRFGRVARDLRVSLIDKCNLRCGYCMPAEGLPWMAADRILTDDEVIRLIRIATGMLGVTSVRFTGGEPLLRKGLVAIIAATAEMTSRDGRPVGTALTTNGIGLQRHAQALAQAGLTRINISVDTLRPERFAAITHRDRLDDVLTGVRAAALAGLTPVKINTVLLPGVNDDEAGDLLAWALDGGYRLRFIEQMPLDAQGRWNRAQMICADEILTLLRRHYHLEPGEPAARGGEPAETWSVHAVPGSPALGTVGIVGSVTRPFCGACERTRLTADGQIRNCLFAHHETDLRTAMRAGADDRTLAGLWRAAMWEKKAGHGIDDEGFLQPARPMSAIGG